jgi:L-arabinokinase
MRSILFYISGHGYGHAVRMGEVIRVLERLHPDWLVIVRSQVSRQMLPASVEFHLAEIDSGVVEREAGVVMDERATLLRLREFVERWDCLVATEAAFVRGQGVNLIVADIPAIAGDVAQAAGVPCIGISNFTWDWIYEPYASEHVERLERAYSRMSVLLRLPFHQPSRLDVFPAIIDAPLIARKHPDLRTPGQMRVLLGSRAEISVAALERAARDAPEFDVVSPGPEMPFSEAFARCDMVISKLGFSMMAECIAAQKPILYPPRQGFREEEILQQHVNAHVAAAAIPLKDFYRGNWGRFLRELASMNPVAGGIRTDGAEFCAHFLANCLE